MGSLISREQALRTKPAIPLVEWQALFDAVDHGRVDLAVLAELPLPLRTLRRSEMAKAWLATHNLPRGGHFQPLRGRLLRLPTCNGSWHNLGRRTLGMEPPLSTHFFRAPKVARLLPRAMVKDPFFVSKCPIPGALPAFSSTA